MAFRDACISHVKNGIYGAMWVSAMIAAAATTRDIPTIIRSGLAQIPHTSRLHEAVSQVLMWFETGVSCEKCFANIHARFDEFVEHDWCHTISNAMIVAMALLYGGGDFGRSICMAVQTGFDTDCNGATVGSVLGMRGGSAAIGEEWSAPLRGQLDTTIFGVGTVTLAEMAAKTMEHMKK
jgi:ADP-ribosylglycohydrolase